MKKSGKKKSYFTLLEVMVVLFLIGLIATVVGVNMKGSLDEGRAFKSRQAAEKVRDILLLQFSQGADLDDLIARPEIYLENSGLVKRGSDLLKDGWNEPLIITNDPEDTILVTSPKLNAYEAKKNSLRSGEHKKEVASSP